MILAEQAQKIQVLEGEYKPVEAYDVVLSFLNNAINFHKLQCMDCWEKDHSSDPHNNDDKIAALIQQKQYLKDMVLEARETGANLSITGNIEIKLNH